MKRQRMIDLCDAVLDRLCELETLQRFLTVTQRACIFRSTPDVNELRSIAILETDKRATTEQIMHIEQICDQLDIIYRHLPQNALGDLQEDD
jgi:hypothetical protein